MGGKDYKVLLIHNNYDRHLQRLIKHLKSYNPEAEIDVFTMDYNQIVPKDLSDCINMAYGMPSRNGWIMKIPYLRNVKRILNLKKAITQPLKNQYDVINIHFPSFYYAYIIKQLKATKAKLLITPWGSDIYRATRWQRKILKRVFDAADYVCGAWNRFCYDVIAIMGLNQDKIVTLDIGSDTIDYIARRKKELLSEDSSKRAWGLQNNYVITCGYNGSRAQHHTEIIEAISNISKDLPSNTLLLFPMTYAGDKKYFNELQMLLVSNGLKYKIITEYLSLEELFNLRMATDIFVHMQSSDANSASVQEYLLCGKKVVNGGWLRYEELEKNGDIPYYIADSFNSLGSTLLTAIQDKGFAVAPSVLEYIESYGWEKWIVKWDAFFKSCKRPYQQK